MADIVAPDVRSAMMAGIRSKHTKPEIILRSGLHREGFRFRLHDRKLPGKPDLVLPKHRAVIFAHGCFWHGHDCHLFKWPKSQEAFWRNKIERNREVDARSQAALEQAGWRCAIVWECALKGRTQWPHPAVISKLANWLVSRKRTIEIEGARAP